MANPVSATPGAGFTGATCALKNNPNDCAGIVTFTTSATIPASPFKLFTLTFAGAWCDPYGGGPTILIGACARFNQSRSAAFMAAVAALGPFYVIPDANNVSFDVYCTNAPATGTAYDIGYVAVKGP